METKPIYVTNLDCAIIMWEARGVQIGHSLCAIPKGALKGRFTGCVRLGVA